MGHHQTSPGKEHKSEAEITEMCWKTTGCRCPAAAQGHICSRLESSQTPDQLEVKAVVLTKDSGLRAQRRTKEEVL